MKKETAFPANLTLPHIYQTFQQEQMVHGGCHISGETRANKSSENYLLSCNFYFPQNEKTGKRFHPLPVLVVFTLL